MKTKSGEATEQNSDDEDDGLVRRFDVYNAGPDCLLLGFGSWRGGMSECMMWVHVESDGTYNKQGKDCWSTTTTMCKNMVKVWTTECEAFHKKEKRAERFAAEEALQEAHTAS